MRAKIELFVLDVCEDLGINAPKISYDMSDFPGSLSAAVKPDNRKVLYIRSQNFDLDTAFAVAHELRHLWQLKWHKSWFGSYKKRDEVSFEAYNRQFAEVDANAYALVIMEDFFNRTPLFNGYSAAVKELIYQRADEI